jgi:hypothetical protein
VFLGEDLQVLGVLANAAVHESAPDRYTRRSLHP